MTPETIWSFVLVTDEEGFFSWRQDALECLASALPITFSSRSWPGPPARPCPFSPVQRIAVRGGVWGGEERWKEGGIISVISVLLALVL